MMNKSRCPFCIHDYYQDDIGKCDIDWSFQPAEDINGECADFSESGATMNMLSFISENIKKSK